METIVRAEALVIINTCGPGLVYRLQKRVVYFAA